jgi:ribosome maturation factor RimP
MAKRALKQSKADGRPAAPRRPDLKTVRQQRQVVDAVKRLADPLCRAEGLELVQVEYQREPGGLTLRLYMDKPGGVALEDCVGVSRQLADLLDVHLQELPPYRLEVSSPGPDRPVGKLDDFARFKGQRANVRVATALGGGRKNFTGVLAGVVDEMIQIRVNKEMISLNFNDITRARLINYNGES